MSEETVGDAAPVVNEELVQAVAKIMSVMSGERKKGRAFRGIPKGLASLGSEVQDFCELTDETWRLCKQAGLTTVPITRTCEFMLTDWLHDWIASKPVLPARPTHKKTR